MAPLRLHANLLFYGLDEGTWCDPPLRGTDRPAAATEGQAATKERAALASIKAVWGEAGGENNCYGWVTTPGASTTIAGAVAEPSTDEGSEHKGSESESLPDSSEGYFQSSPDHLHAVTSLGHTAAMMMPFASPHASGMCSMVEPGAPMTVHTLAPAEATAAYAAYLQQDGYAEAHGFDCGEQAGYPFAYEGYPVAAVAAAGAATAGVPAPEPAVPVPGVPSIGSYAHLSGRCSRCCFHPKGRCANGYSCQFCHFDHDKRARNGKKKRHYRQSDDGVEGTPED